MKRFLTFSLSGLVALVLLAGGVGWAWLLLTLPSTDATIEVAGLETPVEVMRDEDGIPHIFAKTENDAYFALGFVHAQDRFWQMETMRRFGAGRLAEVLGPEAVASDKWMRTLGLYRLAEKMVEKMSEPMRQALIHYAAGVNARLKRSQRLPWGVAAPEFALFQYVPEPWRPADSLVWGKIIAMRLGGNWRDEVLRTRLARKLAPQQVGELWPLYPDDVPRTVEKAAALTRSMDLDRLAALSPIPAGLPRGASNAWVLASRNTVNRGPILANDPHLGFSAPILWYLARIETPDFQITGATVPGVPFTVLGHNGRIAWGMTNTQTDIQDLFVERLDDSGKKYKTPDGWQAFETRTETIAVKGAAAVKITVRETRHGPVVSDLLPKSAGVVGKEVVMALSATFLEPEDGTPEAMFMVNRASNWKTFTAALKGFQAPQSNFMFADTKGDIGYIAPGLVPVRNRGWGLVPSPGWDGGTDWTGYVPFEELPIVFNPPSGRIVNSNNRVPPEGYPHFITLDWSPGFRAKRILDRVDGKIQSVLGASKLQQDHVSEMAKRLLPLMLGVEAEDERSRQALSMLEKWNRRMSLRHPQALIFSTWLYELNRAIYADELGDLFRDYLKLRPLFIVSVLTRRQAWCDDVNTEEPEDCQSRIRLALKRALDRLSETHGDDMKAWRWGDVHQASFPHPVLSRVPGLNRFVNLRIPTDGGNYTVNRGASHVNDPAHPFEHIHGAGFRAVYDLEDLRRSRFIIATGQSGNPASSHYGDLMTAWRDGRYLRMGQTRVVLRNSAAAILTLTPEAARP